MGNSPWSETTEFPPIEEQQASSDRTARVRELPANGPKIPSDKTAIMLDIRTPRWWLPWERMTAVRMWTRQRNRWVTVAYFHHPQQAMNYAEVLAHSIAAHHNMGILGEDNDQENSTSDVDPFAG